MATRSSASRCNYCHKDLRSDSAMKWHIAATPKCKHAWEKDILGLNANTIQKPTSTDLDIPEPRLDIPNPMDDMHDIVPEPSPEPAILSKQTNLQRFVEAYPRPVGIPTGQGKSYFQGLRDMLLREGQGDYSPFANDEEWELAQWLSRRVGQKAIEEYLNLSIVSCEVAEVVI